MRQLATYSFQACSSKVRGDAVLQQVTEWLGSKGKVSEDGSSIALRDGRIAEIARSSQSSSVGNIWEILLTEPRPDGWFRTIIRVAEAEDLIAVSVALGAASEVLAPVYVDVRCPRLVKDLLSPPSPWRYRKTGLSSSPLELAGEAGGDEFIALAWDGSRSVPIVAVSDEYGSVLHPGIVEDLAADLAGLAVVARLDPQASWRITRRKGKEWSCYSGSIRLFWPSLADDKSPYRHPLWTARRLLEGASDTEVAADRIRRQLRRRILGQSAFSVSEAPLVGRIRQAARQEELSSLRAKATAEVDYKSLAEDYSDALERTQLELSEREAEIEHLRAKVAGLQYALQAKTGEVEPDEVEPDTEVPPATVEEAVLLAMDQMEEELVFGKDVTEGVESLASDAGPPEKILRYLRILGEFTRACRSGPLGRDAIVWLREKGVAVSRESETVRSSKKARQARTWDCGNGEKRVFDLHLKPSEATGPDRCVRIYFHYDETVQKTIVGWVGRHP